MRAGLAAPIWIFQGLNNKHADTMQNFAPKTMASVNDGKGPFVTSLTTNVKLGKDNFFFL
jgi:hypothetical protein